MNRRIGRGRALVIAILAAVTGGIAFAVGVGSVLGQRAERSVLDASELTFDPPAPLGLVSVWTVAGALIVIALIAWAVHGLSRGVWFIVAGSAAILGSQLLKQRLLTRPELFDFDAPNTFPSGHMTVFAVISGGLLWASAPRWRGPIGIAAAVLMSIVSWQLLAFGWHRPSDVLGALCLAVCALAIAAVFRLPNETSRAQSPGPAIASMNAIIGAVITVAAVVLILGALVLSIWAARSRSDEQLLLAGQFALIGASAVTARTFLALAR